LDCKRREVEEGGRSRHGYALFSLLLGLKKRAWLHAFFAPYALPRRLPFQGFIHWITKKWNQIDKATEEILESERAKGGRWEKRKERTNLHQEIHEIPAIQYTHI